MNKTGNPFLETLRLPVKNAPILLFVGLFAHIISLFLPWLINISIYIKVILVFLVILSFIFYIVKYGSYKKGNGVKELVLSSEDNWQLKMNDGAVYQGRLGHALFVHPWLTIFSLVYGNSREYFVFTPEILDKGLFRRLRVRLRFQSG